MLTIPRPYADAMVAHALEEDPNECCGLLAARDGAIVKHYRMANSERSPYRYYMDPKELLKAYREIDDSGWELLVIYHSHTHSEAYPSATDVRLATWPEAYYVLISLRRLKGLKLWLWRRMPWALKMLDTLGLSENDKPSPVLRAFHIQEGVVTEEPLVVSD